MSSLHKYWRWMMTCTVSIFPSIILYWVETNFHKVKLLKRAYQVSCFYPSIAFMTVTLGPKDRSYNGIVLNCDFFQYQIEVSHIYFVIFFNRYIIFWQNYNSDTKAFCLVIVYNHSSESLDCMFPIVYYY